MNIIEAAKKMNEGYKVRRLGWGRTMSIHMGSEDPQPFPAILTEEDGIPELDTEDLLATDWEIAQ